MNFHLCQGKIKSFAFLTLAENCATKSCTLPEKADGIHRVECCSNLSLFNTTSAFASKEISLVNEFNQMEAPYVEGSSKLYQVDVGNIVAVPDHPPPPKPSVRTHVAIQVFLI
ncbi:MAG: hypothetical protein JJ975_11725 [Bacteroidia bacterium]|nr:hypothetical protein [Bacteroidia bacterium]